MTKYYQAPGSPASFRFFVTFDLTAAIESMEGLLRDDLFRLDSGSAILRASRYEEVVTCAGRGNASTLLPNPTHFASPIGLLRFRPDGAFERRFFPVDRQAWRWAYGLGGNPWSQVTYFEPENVDAIIRLLEGLCLPGATPFEWVEVDSFDLHFRSLEFSTEAPPPRLRDNCPLGFDFGSDWPSDAEFMEDNPGKRWRVCKPRLSDLRVAFLREPSPGHRFVRLAALGARPKSLVIAIPIEDTEALNRATDAELSYCWRQAALLGACVREVV